MNEILINSNYTSKLTLSDEADVASSVYKVYASLTHEWGNEILDESVATRTAAKKYSYAINKSYLDSAGVYKVHWRYIVSSVEHTFDEYFLVDSPYIQDFSFFENHPELEDESGDYFIPAEKKVRAIIDSFCGQSFLPYKSKTINVYGQNSSSLFLPIRLDSFSEILQLNDDYDAVDITDDVKLCPESKSYLDKKGSGKFLDDYEYSVTGDWGWSFVPKNISLAAELLVVDEFNEDTKYRQHGIIQANQGQRGIRFHDLVLDTTGNLDADILLMDYTKFFVEVI